MLVEVTRQISVRARRRGGECRRPLEEPGCGGADERQDCGPAENIDVGAHGCLLLHEPVDEAKGAGPRACRADLTAPRQRSGLCHRSLQDIF